MLESLMNLVKEHAGEAIVNNPAIPNEKMMKPLQRLPIPFLIPSKMQLPVVMQVTWYPCLKAEVME